MASPENPEKRPPRFDPVDLNLLDPRAFALASAFVAAAALFLATATLVVRGGDPIGPNLALLVQYLPAYSVTWPGGLLGAGYGFAVAFLAGYAFATLRNKLISGYLRHLVRRSERAEVADLLDRLS
jgi:hypothetical protein